MIKVTDTPEVIALGHLLTAAAEVGLAEGMSPEDIKTVLTDAVALPDHSQRGHSKLGASGAERWMACPGSVSLLRELTLPESDEPDYQREGTALHEAAAHCLEQVLDAWEIVGLEFNNTKIDVAMANAVQTYLDYCRPFTAPGYKFWIETAVSSPVHPDFYGSCDFAALLTTRLKVVDLKGGVGIIVEPEDNPQLQYYAFGFIDQLERQHGVEFPAEMEVDLVIVQPRGFHKDGPIRLWTTTVGAIKEFIHDTLVPAMCATEYDHTLDAGEHCRFCPAKLVCPLLTSLFRAAATCDPKEIVNLDDAALGRSYGCIDGVKHYLKALGEEALRRGRAGHDLQPHGIKMVYQKANRVWKEGAGPLAQARFGVEAMTKPELKSPPELEKLSAAAKEFVKEHAYMPVGNLTVAPLTDKRPAVKVEPPSAVFGDAIAALPQGETT